ncbi:unnamed protein product [Schistocephalus solidus]|uniref:Kinase n=1 Tax=Schistocephalus solidus TaxID=70667 RepID=A0A183TRI6_SCHSO|nr:unnamed protein product [Schistocephalus solidus]
MKATSFAIASYVSPVVAGYGVQCPSEHLANTDLKRFSGPPVCGANGLQWRNIYTDAGIRVFQGPNVSRHTDLARAFLARLQQMRKLLSNQRFALYCSSLLLAYSSSRLPTAPIVKTVFKLVDFAHYRSKLESHDVSGFSDGSDTLIRL